MKRLIGPVMLLCSVLLVGWAVVVDNFLSVPLTQGTPTDSQIWKFSSATGKWVLASDNVGAGASDASVTVKGITKLSVAPVSATDPIAVGDNDTRNNVAPAAGVRGNVAAVNAAGTAWTSIDEGTATDQALFSLGANTPGAFRAVAAGDIDELITLAQLAGVTATTGSGTVVVLDTSPTVATPTFTGDATAASVVFNSSGAPDTDGEVRRNGDTLVFQVPTGSTDRVVMLAEVSNLSDLGDVTGFGGTSADLGASASNGSATTVAKSDHVHKGVIGQDEGLGQDSSNGNKTINVTGGGAALSATGGVITINVPGAGAATITIKESGTTIDASTSILDFAGFHFRAVSSPAGTVTIFLDTDSVTSTSIAADAVGSSELADNSVDTGAITDGAVVLADINAAVKSPLQTLEGTRKITTTAALALGTAAAAGTGVDAAAADHVHKGIVGQEEGSPVDSSNGNATLNIVGSDATASATGGVLTVTVSGVPSGAIMATTSNTTVSGWQFCDGKQLSRTTFANLFAAMTNSGSGNTFDITTEKVTFTSHGLFNNDPVQFYTTGTLPGGLSEGTKVYVRDKTDNDFKVCSTPGGAAIDLTGSNGSGTQTWISAPYGDGNGETATTFHVPDLLGRVPAGVDALQGGTAASRLTVGGAVIKTALGESGGTETHALTTAQLAAHTHTGTTASNGSHTHTYNDAMNGGSGNVLAGTQGTLNASTSSAGAHTHTFTSDSTGSGTAHQNTQPTLCFYYIIKE